MCLSRRTPDGMMEGLLLDLDYSSPFLCLFSTSPYFYSEPDNVATNPSFWSCRVTVDLFQSGAKVCWLCPNQAAVTSVWVDTMLLTLARIRKKHTHQVFRKDTATALTTCPAVKIVSLNCIGLKSRSSPS